MKIKDLDINEQDTRFAFPPAQIAIIAKNYEIALMLLENPKIDLSFKLNTSGSDDNCNQNTPTILEEVIKRDLPQFIEIVIKMPNLKPFGPYLEDFLKVDSNTISINDDRSHYYYYYNRNNDSKSFGCQLFMFFNTDSKDESLEKCKEKIIKENKGLLTCLGARFSDETMFSDFLDKYEVDINEVSTEYKITPLISSMLNDKYDTLKIILDKFEGKIEVNYKTPDDITALHVLCKTGYMSKLESIKAFMEIKDLNVNVQEAKHMYTPLHIALDNYKYDIASLLLKNPSIDPTLEDIESIKPAQIFFKSIKSYRSHPEQFISILEGFARFNQIARHKKVIINFILII